MGNIADIVGGGTPSTGNQSYWDGDIDWYAPAEIADQIYANSSQKKITGLGYENSSAKMLPPGTVLFTSRAGIGKTAILTRKGCTNQGFQSIVPHRGELDSYFIFSRTEELKRYGELVGAGSTFVEVSGKQMAVMELMMPPTMREQQTIGGFFQQLDHLITLHQRQHFLHSTPDISLSVRLIHPFYTSSWEQRKLEDYLTVSAEKNTGNIYGRSDVLSVSGDYGIVNQIEFQGRSFAGASVSNYGVVQTGDVVYTKSPLNSNPYGIIKTNKGKPGIVSTLYAVYHPKENAFSDFIQVYFEQHARMNNYMHPLVNKGAKNDMKVSAENALKGPVCFPSRIEQESISAFFSVLDNLITLHQRKCANLCSPSQVVFSLLFATSTFSWEQRKLSEITDKVTEKNAGLQYVETFTNSAEFGIISQRDFFDHDIAKLGSLDGYYIVKNEDFVYNPRISTSAPVGPINRNKLGRTGVMSPLYTVFRPHDIDTTYLEYFFKCGYWHSFMNFNGDSGARSDRFSIRDNVFFQMPIPIPDIDEQRKIGELLTCLDNLITLHQRECISFTGRADRLILTANKKRTTSSWEQRKFSEITFLSGEKNRETLPLESYSITNESGFVPQDEKFENGGTMREADKRMYYIVSPNSFAYNPARINVGSIGYQNTGKNVIVSSLYEIFKTSDDVDDRLLWHWFKSPDFQKLIWQLQEGGVRLYFYYDKLCMGEVSLPSLEEQRKIGKFFDTLDNLITLHQRKPFLMKWRTSDANRNQTNRLVL